MPINVSTVYSEKNLIEFNRYVTKSKIVFWIIMALCSFLVVGSFVFLALINELSFEIYLCLALTILLDLLYVFLYVFLPRITLKKQKSLNTTLNYSFEGEHFSVNAQNEYATENSTVKYTMLSKVARNKNFVYLFISPIQAYVVDISELSYEDVINFKNFLQPHFKPKKFKW